MRDHGPAGAWQIGNGEDQARLVATLLHEGVSLELGSPELSLEVHQPALDLYQNNFRTQVQDNVSGATVWRHPDRDLQLNAPIWVCLVAYHLGDFHLSGIAQTHSGRRNKSHREPVADSRRQSRRCRNVWQ